MPCQIDSRALLIGFTAGLPALSFATTWNMVDEEWSTDANRFDGSAPASYDAVIIDNAGDSIRSGTLDFISTNAASTGSRTLSTTGTDWINSDDHPCTVKVRMCLKIPLSNQQYIPLIYYINAYIIFMVYIASTWPFERNQSNSDQDSSNTNLRTDSTLSHKPQGDKPHDCSGRRTLSVYPAPDVQKEFLLKRVQLP